MDHKRVTGSKTAQRDGEAVTDAGDCNKITGSREVLGSVQLLQDREGMDDVSKNLLRNKEVLAVILKYSTEEFQGLNYGQIMECIEGQTIGSPEISPGRTNTTIRQDASEYKALNEKTSQFDLLFRAVNPRLSTNRITVNLHIGIEPQKDYRPGYAIEKRGIFYLSRELSTQVSPVVTEEVDYGSLEKCYSIWICTGNVPRKECNTVSYYRMDNVRNAGGCKPRKEDYDLLELVIIRLGKSNLMKGAEEKDLLEFLRLLFLPHKEDILQPLSRYIDFSNNEELQREVVRMDRLGMDYFELGREEGIEKGREEGIEKGREEGIEKGRKEAISKMLKKLTIAEVVELGYDLAEVNKVQEESIYQ